MRKPRERHKLTSDNNIIKFKKPVHDPFNTTSQFYTTVILIYYGLFFAFGVILLQIKHMLLAQVILNLQSLVTQEKLQINQVIHASI